MTTQLALFDYTALDAETRIVVQQRTSEIKSLMKRAAQDIIDIGQKLIEVKARLGHGQFGAWLRSEFEWTPQLARQFMNVAEQFSGVQNETIFRFGSSALRLLAAPSTPEAARTEALERAEAGEVITHAMANGIVQRARKEAHADPVTEEAQESAAAPALDPLFDPTPRPGDWWADDVEEEAVEAVEPDASEMTPQDVPAPVPTPLASQRDQQRGGLTSQDSHEWYTSAWCIRAVR